ncbi:ATP-dependent 6-phosphofructokinase [Azospirillum sp. YIM B02556]|uniref:ATP-dependent 6-phosphofructokinase n=1 Tax=Azospirillum endophyticum TaxID=2800326 RepID=A0ABS1EYS5_9PROT|nr:ATP-dependent 6-phosphofructokinase [Azospirillum endophyticum]MBK1836313.1 ATP-dependent 6-phosphofructokinase [Azospirillum endophyticum]
MTAPTKAGKRIGILTSGGDCAGLNAVIRAVVHRATGYGWQVLGIKEGTQGLLQRPVQYQTLDLGSVDGHMMRQGGTILGTTNRGDPFAYPMPDGTLKDRSDEIIGGYRELGLDALIGIGGDGSFAILHKLAQKGGFPMVGVPKTIDNDLGKTEVSVGYDTAVAVAVEALDRLQPTAASHHRVMVLEVMGRDAGHIALAAGIAGGADVILIPEIPYSIESIAAKIQNVRDSGRNFALVVVSEAVKTLEGTGVKKILQGGEKRYGGIGDYIGEKIADATGAETRVTVLGHVQRGSMPSPRDRLIASAFGVHAVDLIAEGRFNRMVAWSNRGVIDVPITEAIEHYSCVELDGALVKTARGLNISFGD